MPEITVMGNTYTSKGHAYYSLGQEMSWSKVADLCSVQRRVTIVGAKFYAKRNGLKWPIKKDNPIEWLTGRPAVRGPLYYEYARTHSDVSWNDIAVHFGIACRTVQATAKYYARKNKLPWPPRPPVRRLTADKVYDIRKAWVGGATQTQLAKEYDVNRTTIHHIVHRMTWRHLTP